MNCQFCEDKVVWDKLDRLKDNLDKEAAKQEASDAGKE